MEGFKEEKITEVKQINVEKQDDLSFQEPQMLSDLLEESKEDVVKSESSLHSEEVKEIIREKLDAPEFAPKEDMKIKKAADVAEVGGVVKRAKKIISEALSQDNFIPEEDIKVKSKDAGDAPVSKEEKEKAVRDAFIKYGAMLADGNIAQLLKLDDEEAEKGSKYFTEMRDAASDVVYLLNVLAPKQDNPLNEAKVSENDLVEAMVRLSETAHIYYDMHRGTRFSKKGENRKEACNLIRNLTDHFFDDMDISLKNSGLMSAGSKVSFTSDEKDKAKSRLKELVKLNKKWRKHFAYNEVAERSNVKEKADLFAVYEREIEIYSSAYRKNPQDMDLEIAQIIKEARYYKVQNRVLKDLEKSGILEREPMLDTAKKHMDEMDYKKSEKELRPEEIDKELSEAQLVAVERIDRWFMRNYNNGGLVGRPLNIKNHHGEIVAELMSKTKRERLFIYYLIEKGARKDPKVFDAYVSQSYTPDLTAFKKQMVANKLKVMSRLVGGYVYMHKLSEAMQINRDYKELIEDCARLAKVEKEGKDANEIKDPLEKRSLLLKKTYQSCKAYKDKAELCNKAKGSKKTALEAEVSELEERFKQDFSALIEADNAVGDAEKKYGKIGKDGEKSADRLNNRQNSNTPDVKSNMDTYKMAGAKAGEFLVTGVNSVMGTAGVVSGHTWDYYWHLEGSNFANVNKYAHGYSASTISCLGNAMAVIYGIYNLCENGAKMHAGDIGREVAEMLKSGADSYISYRTGVELVGKYSRLGKDSADKVVKVSKSLKTASFITSGVGVMLSTYNIGSGLVDGANATNALHYLKKKRKNDILPKNVPENETQEQREARLKKERELRYENDMLNLANEISNHKVMYSGYEAITNIVSVVGTIIPVLGALISVGGTIGGVVISILNAVDIGSIREAMFDRYFHFEDFYAKAKTRVLAKGRKIHDEGAFKVRMRRKLAASAGYSDMLAASDQITKRFADQVCEKLFSGKEVLDENEKKGYIELVKAFGLPYDEEKKIPDAKLLARRLTGR